MNKASDFLEIADRLMNMEDESPQTAKYRAAAIMVYTATVNEVFTIASVLDKERNTKMKTRLIRELQQNPNMTFKTIGFLLEQLLDIKTRAEYVLSNDFTAKDAEQATELAAQITDLVGTMYVGRPPPVLAH